jgi:hypothetical protein
MGINISQKGSFDRTERYFQRIQKTENLYAVLNKYGDMGVAALSAATPRDTGATADNWYYTIQKNDGYYSLRWHNRHRRNGIPIAVLIQYGHATRNGGFVQGIDYIMPAMRPVFDKIAADAWKEVTKI